MGIRKSLFGEFATDERKFVSVSNGPHNCPQGLLERAAMDTPSLVRAIAALSGISSRGFLWGQQKHTLLKACRDLFRAQVCAIFLIRDGMVVLEDHIGYTNSAGEDIPISELQQKMTYQLGPLDGSDRYDGLTGQVATVGEALSINEPSELEQYKSWVGKPNKLGVWGGGRAFRCLFAVPLKTDGKTIGVLKVENKVNEQGHPVEFDDLDRTILEAFAGFFSIGVDLSNFRGLPYDQLFGLTLEWLKEYDVRNLYQNMVELCASLFEADVCSLFVRTGNDACNRRVELVAGRLSTGEAMDPRKVRGDASDLTYLVGQNADGSYDGLTGEIATTGKRELFKDFAELKKRRGHRGKWDGATWVGSPEDHFLSMMGVALKVEGDCDPVGVLKVERAKGGKKAVPFTEEDLGRLSHAASGFAQLVIEFVRKDKVGPKGEHEYRLIRARREVFESKPLGDVVIRHLMTSICQSDLYYFKHQKDPQKLDDRLPMALGHETIGKVLRTGPDARYRFTDEKIRTGDKVVVIPLIPCLTCAVCERGWENYCPSARFMASNAPGSLRTSYPYDPGLLLKIDDIKDDELHLALFTEPMSNIVQLLNDLGFVQAAAGASGDQVNLDMASPSMHHFEYFHVKGERFTNIFNTITTQEPNPKTLFVCTADDPKDVGHRVISQHGIVTKGLALLGDRGHDISSIEFKRTKSMPKVLILGSGISAYLLALVLVEVFDVKPDRIAVTGRDFNRLAQFKDLAQTRVRVSDYNDNERCAEALLGAGGSPGRLFDVVFECVGGEAVESNLDVAFRVLAEDGILAMFGLAERQFKIDFSSILSKRIFVKGTSRSCLQAYQDSLDFITNYPSIRAGLESLVDDATTIRNKQKFHEIKDAEHLQEVFRKAGESRPTFGRLVISSLH